MKLGCRETLDHIRVLVADSNQTQCQVLSAALRRRSGMRVICCGSDLASCMEALKSGPTHIVLLSYDGSDCKRLLRTIRTLDSNHPEIRLILLLESYDRELVVRAMSAGVRGLFCRASEGFSALCRCVRVVHQGQFWANSEQIRYLVQSLSLSFPMQVNANGKNLLTAREEQVIDLVAEGFNKQEVAQQLGVKENTIKKFLQRIYDKLGVSNRVELVLYALAHRTAERPSVPAPVLRAAEHIGPWGVIRLRVGSERILSGRSRSDPRNGDERETSAGERTPAAEAIGQGSAHRRAAGGSIFPPL